MNQTQLYNLDQIEELLKVGLIPADNILASKNEMPYPSENINNFSGGLCMEGKIIFHVGRWKIDFRRRQIGGYIARDDSGTLFWCKEHAEQYLSKIRSDVTSKNFDIEMYRKISSNYWRFDSLFEKHIENATDRKKNKWSHGYKVKVKNNYDLYYKSFFKKMDVRQIEEEKINDFFDQLPSYMAISTKVFIMSSLKGFLQKFKIMRQKQIEYPSPTIPKRVVKWIDQDTQDKILNAMHKWNRPIFQFMFINGVRPCEARALMWDAVDLNHCIVTIKRSFSMNVLQEFTKTKKERILPIAQDFLPVLNSLPRTLQNDFVFRNRQGRAYDRSWIQYIWRDAVKDAGLSPVTMYVGTRHSCGSQLINSDVDVRLIQELLGHSSLKTTEIYTHAKQTKLAEIINLRRGILAQNSTGLAQKSH